MPVGSKNKALSPSKSSTGNRKAKKIPSSTRAIIDSSNQAEKSNNNPMNNNFNADFCPPFSKRKKLEKKMLLSPYPPDFSPQMKDKISKWLPSFQKNINLSGS